MNVYLFIVTTKRHHYPLMSHALIVRVFLCTTNLLFLFTFNSLSQLNRRKDTFSLNSLQDMLSPISSVLNFLKFFGAKVRIGAVGCSGLERRPFTVKKLSFFPSPAGMSLTKLAGNNLIIPGRGEFGKSHPGWGRDKR